MSARVKYGAIVLGVMLVAGMIIDNTRPPEDTTAAAVREKPKAKAVDPEPQKDQPPAPPPLPPIQEGDTVRLVYAGHEDLRVPSAVTWEVYKQLENTLAIGDDVGLRELASSRSVTFLEPGTEALLLHKGLFGSQVRIIARGRPSDGKAMWVQADHVARLAAD